MRSFILTACCVVAVAAPAFADDARVATGHDLFQYHCAPCHGSGLGMIGRKYLPGTDALNVKYKGTLPALLEERTDLTPQFVTVSVRHGVKSMPSFRKVTLSDPDLAAIAAYLSRNTR